MEPKEINKKKLIGALEALLFTYGEPMEVIRIAKILSSNDSAETLTAETIFELGATLADELANEGRGLALLRDGEKLQLVTKPEMKPIIEGIIKEELVEALTPAALETIAIIAYAGTAPRSTVDYIRGVNSSFIIRNLLLRGLLERIPDPKRANAYLYQPSFDLLRHLGISKREDLPNFAKFQGLVAQLIKES